MRWFTHFSRLLSGNDRWQRVSRGSSIRPRVSSPQLDCLENRLVPSGFQGALSHVGVAVGDFAHVRTFHTPAVMILGQSASDHSEQKSGNDRHQTDASVDGKRDLASLDIKGKDDSSAKVHDQSSDNSPDGKNDSPEVESSHTDSSVEDTSQGHQ